MQKVAGKLTVVALIIAVIAIGASREKATCAALPAHYETATLAGGCFWGLQETLRVLPGVIKTTAGYTGGTAVNPTYEQVAAGRTGHTEAVQVIFDPARLSYEQLLADFLTLRNPTHISADANSSSRSGIFYYSEEQKQIAERVKDKINQSGKWKWPVATKITPAMPFYTAEEYHQDYYRKNSGTHSCSLF